MNILNSPTERSTPADPPPSVTMFNAVRASRLFEFCGGRVAAYACRSPGKLTNNEDSLAAVSVDCRSGVLAIADGVGGERWGDRASRTALESLIQSLQDSPLQEDARPAILNGIELANQQVLRLGGGAASTLSLVEVQENVIRPYHIGDSMMMLVGLRGRVKWQTVPHSPVGYAVEAGVLDAWDAMHHEDRHLVSNIVGAENMRIEIGPRLVMAPRDTLIVASDGLFDNLHLSEVVELIRKGPLEKALDRLTAKVTERMAAHFDSVSPRSEDEGDPPPSKPDDISVLIYRRW